MVPSGNAQDQSSCPSSDAACFTISKTMPATSEWCISTSGNCKTGLQGKQRWSAVAYDCSSGTCVETYKVRAVWDPHRGNPSTETISTRQRKPTAGYTYQVDFYACPIHPTPSDPGCIRGYEGVAVVKP